MMKKINLLLIPTIILFSSAISDNIPCGNACFFRVGLDDLPGFYCCLSDSFNLQSKQIDRDTFSEQCKGQFLLLEMYSTESNSDQVFFAILKDKTNGKVFQSRLTCENSSTYFSSLLFLKKLHKKSAVYSDFSICLIKIVKEGKDTLQCDLGNMRINYLKK